MNFLSRARQKEQNAAYTRAHTRTARRVALRGKNLRPRAVGQYGVVDACGAIRLGDDGGTEIPLRARRKSLRARAIGIDTFRASFFHGTRRIDQPASSSREPTAIISIRRRSSARYYILTRGAHDARVHTIERANVFTVLNIQCVYIRIHTYMHTVYVNADMRGKIEREGSRKVGGAGRLKYLAETRSSVWPARAFALFPANGRTN